LWGNFIDEQEEPSETEIDAQTSAAHSPALHKNKIRGHAQQHTPGEVFLLPSGTVVAGVVFGRSYQAPFTVR
jgi:hypothetical protein